MNQFEKILLTLFFVEIFVGGGGRLIEVGPLSIRQVLFILILLTYAFRIIKTKAYLNKDINTLVRFTPVSIGIYILLVSFFISGLIGYFNGHALSTVITDMLRVSFFILYFPLAYYISTQRFSISRVISILKYSVLAVAIFTIVISLLGKTVFSNNFAPFYNFLNTIMNDDLFFRPSNSVFYKSHVYILIGLIISLNALFIKKFTKLDVINVILCSISLIWSETRGFLLAFVLSVLAIILIDAKVLIDPLKGLAVKLKGLIKSKLYMKKFTILIIVILAVPFLYENMTLGRFQEEVPTEQKFVEKDNHVKEVKPEVNDVSVNSRLEFILDSKDILLSSPAAFIIGTGYGTEIAGRVTGIEMSMLDILVEQGIIGLSIWLFLCLVVIYNFYIAFKNGNKLENHEVSMLAAFIGLLLLTNINPFINNPIGITFFLIMLVFSENKKRLIKS